MIYGVDFAVCENYPLNKNKQIQFTDKFMSKNQFEKNKKTLNFKLSNKFNSKFGKHLSTNKFELLQETQQPIPYLYCEEEYIQNYFNLPEVQTALNVVQREYNECDDYVWNNWDQSVYDDDMSLIHEWIADNHSHIDGFKAMIFSGDNDAICATLGTQQWLDQSFGDNVQTAWAPWKYDSFEYGEQVGGFAVDQDNG